MIRFNRFSSAAALLTAGMVAAGIGGAAPGRAETVPPHVPSRILVQFKPTATAEQVRNALAANHAQIQGEIPKTGVKILKLSANANDMAVMRAFAQRPEVRFAELDKKRKPFATPNDTYFGNEWHLTKIGAPTAWNTTTGSNSVTIAILDTGVDGTHPDLSAKTVAGWNFYDNTADTTDVFGHGTEVAGSAAACSNNSKGVASPAWNCMLMPIRISDTQGFGYDSCIANGLTWAADHGARVANISYFCTDGATIQAAAKYFQSKGGVVTVAAGNDTTVLTTPDCPYMLTISATNSSDTITTWSNTGSCIDVAAPGSGIYTTSRGGGFGSWSGTSFSAPITAGVAALVISVNPSLTGPQVRDVLIKSALDLGAAGWDPVYGFGRVDAAKAVSMAAAGAPADTTIPTATFTSPASGATVAGAVSVQISATDNIGVTSVGFYVDDVLISNTTASHYTFSWDSTKAGNGSHVLKAIASDAAGNMGAVTNTVTVGNPVNQAPMVAAPASGASIVVGKDTNLSVLGADDGGEANLSYMWVASGPAAVTFSANATNSAKNTNALFTKAGNYAFTVTIKDSAGLTTSSSVSLSVAQTANSIVVTPGAASVATNNSQQFAGTTLDQFGTAMSVQPALTWSVSGGGSISTAGLFTAGSTSGGPFAVTATGGVSGAASVTVVTAGDTIAPSVTITSPLTGSKVSGTITVSAAATDNVGVVKVELWVDGKLSSADTTNPWAFSLNTKGWKTGSKHTLQSKAYDAAGNVGISATISVSK